MTETLTRLSQCVEVGKINKASPYPPNMKDQEGADELAKKALEEGCKPGEILENALIPAMANVGNKFSRQEIFVPQMLMSAKAMSSAMAHLKPFFLSGETKRKGTFIIGTVTGDLHDIGKNLVSMMLEGSGFEIIDLGTDVPAEKFVEALKANDANILAMSALLTTTMPRMKDTMAAVDAAGLRPKVKVMVGGAPVTETYAKLIGADGFATDASKAVNLAKSLLS